MAAEIGARQPGLFGEYVLNVLQPNDATLPAGRPDASSYPSQPVPGPSLPPADPAVHAEWAGPWPVLDASREPTSPAALPSVPSTVIFVVVLV